MLQQDPTLRNCHPSSRSTLLPILPVCTRKDPYEGHIVVIDYLPADPEKLSWTLPDLQWVNFQQDFENGCRELLRIWGKGYKALPR